MLLEREGKGSLRRRLLWLLFLRLLLLVGGEGERPAGDDGGGILQLEAVGLMVPVRQGGGGRPPIPTISGVGVGAAAHCYCRLGSLGVVSFD